MDKAFFLCSERPNPPQRWPISTRLCSGSNRSPSYSQRKAWKGPQLPLQSNGAVKRTAKDSAAQRLLGDKRFSRVRQVGYDSFSQAFDFIEKKSRPKKFSAPSRFADRFSRSRDGLMRSRIALGPNGNCDRIKRASACRILFGCPSFGFVITRGNLKR